MARRADVFDGAVFGLWKVIEDLSDEWTFVRQTGRRIRQSEVDCQCLCGRVLVVPIRNLHRGGGGCVRCAAEYQVKGHSINLATPEKIAWAAGLFEGEGSIMLVHQRGWWVPLLSLGMTDEDVVRRYHSIVGRGAVRGPVKRANRKPMFNWRANGWYCSDEILTAFLPHLGKRRGSRARYVLARERPGMGNPRGPYQLGPPEWPGEAVATAD